MARTQRLQAFQNTIEQIVLADQLGFHSVWTVEHHFLDEYSILRPRGVLYGALAAKTKNIRIGHGVRLLPFPYNHPVRAAEAAATVDILSNGRLEFGTGRSGTRAELEGFGIDPNDTRAMWEEALELVVGSWTEETFSYEGKYFTLPPRGSGAQAAAAAAPAAVGGVVQLRQPRADRAEGVGVAVVLGGGPAGEPGEAVHPVPQRHQAGQAGR